MMNPNFTGTKYYGKLKELFALSGLLNSVYGTDNPEKLAVSKPSDTDRSVGAKKFKAKRKREKLARKHRKNQRHAA